MILSKETHPCSTATDRHKDNPVYTLLTSERSKTGLPNMLEHLPPISEGRPPSPSCGKNLWARVMLWYGFLITFYNHQLACFEHFLGLNTPDHLTIFTEDESNRHYSNRLYEGVSTLRGIWAKSFLYSKILDCRSKFCPTPLVIFYPPPSLGVPPAIFENPGPPV